MDPKKGGKVPLKMVEYSASANFTKNGVIVTQKYSKLKIQWEPMYAPKIHIVSFRTV